MHETISIEILKVAAACIESSFGQRVLVPKVTVGGKSGYGIRFLLIVAFFRSDFISQGHI